MLYDIHDLKRDRQHAFRHEFYSGYGRYYFKSDHGYGEVPVSPVDLATYYHDKRYGFADEKYLGPGKSRGGNFTKDIFSGNRDYVLASMSADLQLGGDIIGLMGQGLWHNIYQGRPLLLVGDIVYGTIAFAVVTVGFGIIVRGTLYSALSVWDASKQLARLNVMGAVATLSQAAVKLAEAAIHGAANLIEGSVILTAGAVKSIVQNPAKATIGFAAGAVIGGLLLPGIGSVVGGIIGAVIGSVCFITTAVCRSLGEPDDGPILMELRKYRDAYMAHRPVGNVALRQYYRIAPLIVARVNTRSDAEQVWRIVMDRFIVPAVESIRTGKEERAFQCYQEMLRYLFQRCGLSTEPKFALPLSERL